MPSLIVQTDDTTQAGLLTGRVLIGRKPINTIAIDHPAVSRIHAWIEPRDGRWVVGDCGGRNGTYVNGHHIDRVVSLEDGDEIHVGRTTITFRATDDLPTDAAPLDLNHQEERLHADASGFLVACACGAPVWVPNFLGGCDRPCGHCGQTLRLPPAPPTVTTVGAGAVGTAAAAMRVPSSLAPTGFAAAPPGTKAVCNICQCGVQAGEAEHTCPDCGLTFHRDCWDENLGCSSYGCSQVDALNPKATTVGGPAPDDVAASAESRESADALAGIDVEPDGTPREHLCLAASVVAALLGMLTFGGPAVLVLVAGLVYLRRRPRLRGVVLASVVVSLLGIGAGAVLSYYWWLR